MCAISSRFLPSRPGLHKIAMHFAKTCAATAFVDGTKSVELVQAYFLMSIYGLPARRWEEDRSWFYGGLASRCVRVRVLWAGGRGLTRVACAGSRRTWR